MEGTSASTSCSDTDLNGIGGILSFAATFTNVRTGEPTRVEFVSSEDIDEPGTYEGRLSVGEAAFPVLVRVPRTTILYFAESRT